MNLGLHPQEVKILKIIFMVIVITVVVIWILINIGKTFLNIF